jgi:hypothetical protein
MQRASDPLCARPMPIGDDPRKAQIQGVDAAASEIVRTNAAQGGSVLVRMGWRGLALGLLNLFTMPQRPPKPKPNPNTWT